MKRFHLTNNIAGWFVFLIAAIVYLMTIEPTGSFWDCGEFIVSAFKLEVGHPPGAPLFMLIGNIFSHLSDPSNAGKMVNVMSALLSALTIMFLFWTITHLVRRMIIKEKEAMTVAQNILILGCGLVGALAYTFSDTFWFSAVEGEVYAFSSFFTAIVFWLILKWEENADAPHADRWIILIAYLMGLSIGVHLLNLLCIPAIVLVYYYKKTPNPTLKGTVYALLISFAIVVFMLYGIIQGIVEVCGLFELLAVNVLGMPYNTGTYLYVIVVMGSLLWAIWESSQSRINDKRMKISFILSVTLLGIPFIGNGYLLGIVLIAALTIFMFKYKKINIKAINTILVSCMVIFIGYSTFALILIRATADTPMNQNKPSDIFTLRTYLAREQYGETPLFYGTTYVSEIKRERNKDGSWGTVKKKGVPVWMRIVKEDSNEKDRYYIAGTNDRAEYVDETCTLFPRMHSLDPNHVSGYQEWGRVKGAPVRLKSNGESQTVMKPTFAENLTYFFNYQVNYMYWRYFMWNFSGRQNDFQGEGDIMKGNWITGIKFIDAIRLGPQDDMPFDIAQNKAHNKFYMLPLLLGILGICVQVLRKGNKGIQTFWITFFLFFMTGLAIVLYLNQPPFQPRERDYAYAGSFYAFCIWIGFGVAGIAQFLEQRAKLSATTASAVASLICVLIPIQMGSQTWDDHDRSGRYLARDFGGNYLESCEPNAVIFTHGDNDTFPLWYAQEVEGKRTDVRVCNMSYFQTDWYINQMKRQAYESDPLPIAWQYKDYIKGKLDVVHIISPIETPVPLKLALDFINNEKNKWAYGNELLDYIRANQFSLPVDSATVMKNNVVNPEHESLIEPELILNYEDKNYLTKLEIATMDMILNNQWKRPIYFASTVPKDMYGFVSNYLLQTGMANQLIPVYTNENNKPWTDRDFSVPANSTKMYDNVMNKFKWGGVDTPGLYLEENSMRMCKMYRSNIFINLAGTLVDEGKIDSARQVVNRCVEVLPDENVPYDIFSIELVRLLYFTDETAKAQEIAEIILERSMTELNWLSRLKPSQRDMMSGRIKQQLFAVHELIGISSQYDEAFAKPYIEKLNQYSTQFAPIFSNR